MTVTLNRISKRIGDHWVLRDIELSVDAGEIIGILGATASGKSTLLRIIAGDEKPSMGELSVIGSTHLASRRRPKSGIGALFGSDTSSDGEKAVQLLDEALASSANVILIDGLFADLDEIRREHYIAKFRELAASGRIIIVAANELHELARMCGRLAVLAGSELVQTGLVQDVYDNPANVAVAKLAGRNNLFEARRLSSTNADLPEFLTLVGEHQLTARSTEKAALGAINRNVTLSIRPEHISISFEASFPEDNIIKAVVTGIRFAGPTTLISLDANGLILEARVFRVVGLNIGEQCMIAIPPHRILVLKD